MRFRNVIRGVAVALLAVNALVSLTQAFVRAREPMWSQDFLGVYRASRLWMHGQNPYHVYSAEEWTRITGEPPLPTLPVRLGPSTLYPPFSLMFAAPVSWLPWDQAKTAWALINMLAAAIAPFLIWRLVGDGQRGWTFLFFLLLWFGAQGVRVGIANGQHTFITLAALAGALLCLRSGRNLAAGLLLVLSLHKFPLVIYFVILAAAKLRFRALAWLAAGSTILMVLFLLPIQAPLLEVSGGLAAEWAYWSQHPAPRMSNLHKLNWDTDIETVFRQIVSREQAKPAVNLLWYAGFAAFAWLAFRSRDIKPIHLSAAALITLWAHYNGIYNTLLLAFVLPVLYFRWRDASGPLWKVILAPVLLVLLCGYLGFANHHRQLFGDAIAGALDTGLDFSLRLAIFSAYWIALVLWFGEPGRALRRKVSP